MSGMRYSDRKRLAEQGNLGPLGDDASESLRVALGQVADELRHRQPAGQSAYFALVRHWRQHFAISSEAAFPNWWIRYEASTDDLLDFVEILVEEAATKTYRWPDGSQAQGWPDVEERITACSSGIGSAIEWMPARSIAWVRRPLTSTSSNRRF
jgi:hypothetical protein